jgi:membrane-bound serine protease (ClpP class)
MLKLSRSSLGVACFFAAVAAPILADSTDGVSDENVRGVMITLKGEINDVAHRSLKDRLEIAYAEHSPDLIFLQIDTFGGALKSALDMGHLLRGQKATMVAYIKPRALSAGALIALACDQIVMHEGSRMGDCAPIAVGAKLEGVEREKAESPTRAEFRASAQKNGYNELLAMSMVSDYLVVHKVRRRGGEREDVRFVDTPTLYRLTGATLDETTGEVREAAQSDLESDKGKIYEWVFEKTVVRGNELLTMTDKEAVELRFAKKVVASEAELAGFYGVSDPFPVLEENWSQRIAAYLGSMEIRGLLMLLLIVCIYIESNTPGVGFAGAGAIVCLALMLGAPYLTGLANMWEILLILIGVGLLLVEILIIPGFGVAGISGAVLILFGIVMTFVEEPIAPSSLPFPQWSLLVLGLQDALVALLIALIGAPISCWLLARNFHRLPIIRDLQLDHGVSVLTPQDRIAGAFGGPALGGAIPLEIGAEGVSESPLRPAGKVRFGQELVDVVADGEFITVGAAVQVVQVQGNRIVVRLRTTA